jgi:uncharacterized protein (TIGR03437 family)
MRARRIAIAFCFTLPLFAQSCVTFAGLEIANGYTGSDIAALALQPNGSYSEFVIAFSPPYSIVNLVPNFDQWIGNCISPPTAAPTGPPSFSASPTAIGAASQIVAFGEFSGSLIVGITATASPEPMVTVGVLQNGAFSLTNYPVPDGAATVASADFNNDGNVDLAVVYTGTFNTTGQTTGGVAILLGNGDGTFQKAVNYPAGMNALHVAIADLNGDGKLDLAVAADSGNNLTILLGNGDGTFRAGSTITVGRNPAAVIAADFNRDGKLDLATANEDGTVSILLGNNDGMFQAPQNFPAGSDCAFLAAGDFNKDGKLDLAVTNFDGSLIAVLLGKGDGTFGTPAIYSATSNPTGLILTDFNHDGNLDIVIGSGSPDIIAPDFGSGDIGVLLGNGDGTFQGGPLYPVGSAPKSIAAGDLNGDGKPDLVTANSDSSTLTILLNQGHGTFAAAAPYSLKLPGGGNVGPDSVALADLNRDGKMDVAAANSTAGSVTVSLGNGDGTFGAPTFYPTGNDPVMVAIGDLNGDGNPDLVVANVGTLESDGADGGSVSILLGSGGGAFDAAANITTGVQPGFVALQDINGDGKLDLIVLNLGVGQGFTGISPDPGGVTVLLGAGDGSFQKPVNYAAGTNPSALAVGDLNGDGHPDLAVATTQPDGSSVVAIFLGKGDGTFQNPSFMAGQSGVPDIAIADLNGDGKPDIVIASCCGDTEMSYLLGNGDGTFQPEVYFNGGPSPYFIAAADFNGDGKTDLAIADSVGGSNGYVTVLLNTTQKAAFTVALATAGQVEPLAVQAIVSVFGTNLATGTMAATMSPLPTSLAGTTVTVLDSAGVARQAPLFFVSPLQINFEIPDGTALGSATVTIKNQSGAIQIGLIDIENVSPGLFELDSSGLVAAWALPVISGAQQSLLQVYQIGASNSIVPSPINLGPATEEIYLEMYGTGIRNATAVTATVGGLSVPVLSFSAAPGFAGEDQVNIGPLPRSLGGQGTVNIVLTADGKTANTVNVNIQ